MGRPTESRVKKRQAALLFVFFFVLGAAAYRLIDSALLPTGLVKPAAEAAAYARKLAVEQPDDAQLRAGAVAGVLQALGDPYAQYFPPKDADEFNKALTGEYVGIGAEVDIQDGYLVIVTPLERSPALKAGLTPGDRITAIGTTSTFERPIAECISLLQGTPGTPVSVTVEREGVDEPFDVEIERDDIVSSAVRGFRREPGDGDWEYLIDPERGIAFVRLTSVTPRAAEQLEGALARIAERATNGGLKGLVLDMRDNPGGDLHGAVDVGSLFLDGETIVSVRGRDGRDTMNHDAKPGEALPGVPIAVLVDALSASAAEVLAGAMQDHERAIVIGERTLGKGTVQSVIPLQTEAGAYIKFTTQLWYMPSGRQIHRDEDAETWGVDPTPGFAFTETRTARGQRIRARRPFDIIPSSMGEGLESPEQRWTDPEWIENELADPTLAAALRAVRDRAATGSWTPVVALDAPVTLGDDELDLWPDTAEVGGGELIVRDLEGDVVSRLRIIGEDLEQFLVAAGVEPIDDEAEDEPDESGSE